jgi:quercetin dioxygenase-like cupin family protein
MKIAIVLVILFGFALSIRLSSASPELPAAANSFTVTNSSDAKWKHDAEDPAGTESVVLREDPQTGGFEIFARYSAGHVFPPHWHSANERIVLLEGQMSIEVDGVKKTLDPGGYAYLPAKEIQKMACVSTTRCSFYVHWDGKLDFHAVAEK